MKNFLNTPISGDALMLQLLFFLKLTILVEDHPKIWDCFLGI